MQTYIQFVFREYYDKTNAKARNFQDFRLCLNYYNNINCYFYLISQSTVCTGEEKALNGFLPNKGSM